MPNRRECVFLVRMWRDAGDTGEGLWRGSIHEVATGRRRYLSAPADISEFVEGALRSLKASTAETPSGTPD
jgi:hypothetical protein